MSNIYFIRHGLDGPIKIGRARDVARRLKTLQTASPVPLLLLGVIPGGALTRPPAPEPLTPERAREVRNMLAALGKAPGDLQALLLLRRRPGQEVL
jgi:hypothetical protein